MGFHMPEIHPWMPWVLSAASLTSLWLIKQEQRSGWLLGAVTSAVFVVYNILTDQRGFVLENIIGVMICISGYRTWRHKAPSPCACDDRGTHAPAHREDEAAHQTAA